MPEQNIDPVRWKFGVWRRPMGAEFAFHIGIWPPSTWNPHRYLDVRLGWIRLVAGWQPHVDGTGGP